MAMKTVRFRARDGHLEPVEPVTLIEGSEVDVAVPVVQAGAPLAVLAAMRQLPDIDPSHVDDLERAIAAGKLPVQAEGAFDPSSARGSE